MRVRTFLSEVFESEPEIAVPRSQQRRYGLHNVVTPSDTRQCMYKARGVQERVGETKNQNTDTTWMPPHRRSARLKHMCMLGLSKRGEAGVGGETGCVAKRTLGVPSAAMSGKAPTNEGVVFSGHCPRHPVTKVHWALLSSANFELVCVVQHGCTRTFASLPVFTVSQEMRHCKMVLGWMGHG